MPTPQDIVFARFAQDYGLLSDEEADRCWREQDAARARGEFLGFPEAAERLGVLSPYQKAGIAVLIREAGQKDGGAATRESDSSASSAPSAVSVASGSAVPAARHVAPVSEGPLPTPDAAGEAARGAAKPATGAETVADPPREGAMQAGSGLSGRAVVGDYTILRELGRGGMGIVYEAVQLKLNRRVALKVLSERGLDLEAFQRLKREALATAKLNHENVVRVYDFGVAEGLPYFTMEFVPGASLVKLVGRPEVTFERAARLMLQAAEGLKAAHAAGIVHRDIKPGNLLVTESDRVVVTDFGLARDSASATITQSNQVMGTPRYMSPEQANGVRDDVDHRTDVYSLGATLYELATGKPIFEEKDGHIFHQVLFRDPKSPRKHRPDIPLDLETIMLKATAKDAKGRYAGMAEFAEDLRRFVAGEGIRARRRSVVERVWRGVRGNRRAVGVVAVAVVVVAVIIWGLVAEAGRRSEVAEREGRRRKALELVQQAEEVAKRIEISVPETATLAEELEAARKAFAPLAKAIALAKEAVGLGGGDPIALSCLAHLYLRSGEYSLAIEALEAWIKVSPEDDLPSYLLGRALHESVLTKAAIEQLGRVVERAQEPLLTLARSRLELIRQRPADALALVDGSPRTPPYQAEILRVLGLVLSSTGNADDLAPALENVLRCIGRGQATSADYRFLGRLNRDCNHIDEARSAYLLAMAHHPYPGRLLLERTILFGNTARGLAALDYYVAIYPQEAGGYMNRAEINLAMGQPTAAEQDLAHAATLSPDDPFIVLRLMNLYKKWRGTKSASDYYARPEVQAALAPEKCIGTQAVYIAMLSCLLEFEELPDLGRHFELGSQLFQDDASFNYLHGQYLHRAKDYDGAIRLLTRAVTLAPYKVKAYVWLSRSYSRKGDLRQSIRSLSQAIQVAPDDRDLYVKRGLTYLVGLDLPRGLRDLEHAALMFPLDEVESIRDSLLSGEAGGVIETRDERLVQLTRQLMPKLSDGLCKRGQASLSSGEVARARDCFERARIIAPTRWESQFGLAEVCAHLGEWDLAVFRLQKALELGCRDFTRIESTPTLAVLRKRQEFEQVRGAMQELRR